MKEIVHNYASMVDDAVWWLRKRPALYYTAELPISWVLVCWW